MQYLPSRNRDIGTANISIRINVFFHGWCGESYENNNMICTGIINNMLAKIKHKPTSFFNTIKKFIIYTSKYKMFLVLSSKS